MTAEEFLRALASRAEVVQVAPVDVDEDEDVADHLEKALVVRLDSYDADALLALTGLRVE